MALKSTVFKATLQVADIDHAYYADHALTLARHPSETDQRLMVRLCALALQACKLQSLCAGDGNLNFGAGLSDPDEPDVVLRDFTGAVRLWVEVGQPEDKALLKACAKADEVVLYCFSQSAELWWRSMQGKLLRPQNLRIYRLPAPACQALVPMVRRNMQLQATIQEGHLLLSDGQFSVVLEPELWR